MAMERSNISQGHKAINTSDKNTISFLDHNVIKNIPADSKMTYAHIVVDYRLQNPDPNRVRITISSILINYLQDVTTPTADLVTDKIL